MNENANSFNGDGGGGDGGDNGEESTPVADFASLATTRLAREGCAAAIAAGRLFEAVAGLGLDMRWDRNPSKRVMRLIAVDSYLKDGIEQFVEIVGNMRAIRHLVTQEAKELQRQEDAK